MNDLPQVNTLKGVLIVFVAGAVAAMFYYVAMQTFLPKAEGYLDNLGVVK